jgi:hypothetical protein
VLFSKCVIEIIWYFRETKLGLWVECLCVLSLNFGDEIFGVCELASDIWQRNEKEEPRKNKVRWEELVVAGLGEESEFHSFLLLFDFLECTSISYNFIIFILNVL